MEYLLKHLWETVWDFFQYYLDVSILSDNILSGLLDIIRPVTNFLFGFIDILVEVANDLVQFIMALMGG